MPDVDLWMMNTGFVGGSVKEVAEGNAHKVKIRHSSAMLEALLEGNVAWKQDPDFGYMVVDVDAPENAALIEKVPVEILNPVIFYKNKNRMGEYTEWVGAMKSQRGEFLRGYNVDEKIISAVIRP
jgi:ATP-dependent phosphoenolpyruvate carboxykinase